MWTDDDDDVKKNYILIRRVGNVLSSAISTKDRQVKQLCTALKDMYHSYQFADIEF